MLINVPGTDYFAISLSRRNCPRHKLKKRLLPRLVIMDCKTPWNEDMQMYTFRWLAFRMDWYSI